MNHLFSFIHFLENKGYQSLFFVIKVLQAYKVDFSFLEGRIYFSTVMDVCTFFLLNLLFRSVGFWLKKSCIYSLNFFTLFLLIFKKIFSFFKSHSLFKLFWNCDWHVFRTCRFFFLKKIEGLFFARWLMRLPLKMSAASGQKKKNFPKP